MPTKANIIVKYANSDGYGKVNIICRNYSNFLCLVDVHEKRIKREIIEEKLFNRAEERGDLGVKVQTSRSVASPVENEVISDCELDEAIKSGIACKIANLKTGVCLLKCKKIFYIIIDISSVSEYNNSEEMEGGHRNEV